VLRRQIDFTGGNTLVQILKLTVQIGANYSAINGEKKLLKVHFSATGVLV